MKKIISLGLFLSVLLGGCQLEKQQPETPPKVQQKIEAEAYLRIEATNKLLYYMVKDIVKDRHNVEYMMVKEDEQWKYKYSRDSLDNISKKDLFIYFGGGFEPWVDGFVDDLKKEKVSIVNTSRGVKLISLDNPRKYDDTELKDNPYYWMDANYYEIALANIKNAIQEKDPKNRNIYEDNFNEAIKKLEELDKKISEVFDRYKHSTFITLNDNMDYFLRYKGIKALKLDEKNISNTLEELNKKKSEGGQFILVYDESTSLAGYSPIIGNYNIKTIKLEKYDADRDYLTLLNGNYNALALSTAQRD